MGARIQIRRGSAVFWDDENPILFPGEPGFVKNTRQMKIGDGVTPWRDLPYFTGWPNSGTGGSGGGGTGGGGTGDDDFPDLVGFYNNGKV